MSSKQQFSHQKQLADHVKFIKDMDDDTTMSALQLKLIQVKELYKEFETNQKALEEASSSDEELELQLAKRSQFSDQYFYCHVTLQEKIIKLEKNTTHDEGNSVMKQRSYDFPKDKQLDGLSLDCLSSGICVDNQEFSTNYLRKSANEDANDLKSISKGVSLSEFLHGIQAWKETVNSRLQSLDMIRKDRSSGQYVQTRNHPQSNNYKASFKQPDIQRQHQRSDTVCICCNGTNHRLYGCDKYNQCNVKDRKALLKSSNLCFNCLADGHSVVDCSSLSRCKMCKGKHHTSIHIEKAVASSNQNNRKLSSICSSNSKDDRVLLATAIISVLASNGETYPVKALVDPGSENTIITSELARKLGLLRKANDTQIVGLGDVEIEYQHSRVTLHFSSYVDSKFSMDIESIIMEKIAGDLPSIPIHRENWPHLKELEYADPQFDRPSPVEILLGAEAYEKIIQEGIVRKTKNSPTAINSSLGWLLFGLVKGRQNVESPKITTSLVSIKLNSLEKTSKLSWEEESIPERSKYSSNVQIAIKRFWENFQRQVEIEENSSQENSSFENQVLKSTHQNQSLEESDARSISVKLSSARESHELDASSVDMYGALETSNKFNLDQQAITRIIKHHTLFQHTNASIKCIVYNQKCNLVQGKLVLAYPTQSMTQLQLSIAFSNDIFRCFPVENFQIHKSNSCKFGSIQFSSNLMTVARHRFNVYLVVEWLKNRNKKFHMQLVEPLKDLTSKMVTTLIQGCDLPILSIGIQQKWLNNQESIQVGQLVLLREDNTPQATWPIAKILEVYPDEEKVSVLPIEENYTEK